ncbi:DNA adenine methylase [Pseudogulbenkiania ferrooxidans]|uniref:D12 class N6 adenine-specific DNA methyltransferase n=1 Tax=Pseudogulbenkiania ferrooxidans 2002 TaxID=279714 RepID=B9YYR2_9NEIS|nr:DNA adenine methylase [Pseudogulbenkiania ferrooxidans]EEG10265.1 D12 class N6 adenine-specific DNA methyltransferase [Pseudogulbenkiania ferrooxidans 2002]
MTSNITRPAMRYHGGKFRLAPWILSFLPEHRVYVEPFGGGGSVLLRKDRSHAEVYNDLDGEVVNLFRVVRDSGDELVRQVELTPFAREEFKQAYQESADPIEQARRTLVRSYMGFGSAGASGQSTGFRANSNRSNKTPAHDWADFPSALASIVDRFRGVVIENRDALQCMQHHDSETTLHYVDPPYVHSTRNLRTRAPAYRHEMSDDDHRQLAAGLRELRGMVVLSGYPCELYDQELFADWERHECRALADGAKARTEVIWLNPACSAALHGAGLFAAGTAA